MKTTLKIFFLLLIANLSFAQSPYYKQYTVDDGLAQSQVISICIDNMERIWAGTNGGGISVFDGVKFINYTTDDELAGNFVSSLYRASNNNILIGTEKGISIFDGKKITAYIDTVNDFNYTIRDIIEDVNSTYILATSKGLLKFKNGVYSQYLLDSLIDNTNINCIFFAKDSTFWIGTSEKGVFSIKDKIINNYTKKEGLKYNTVRTILQDTLGNIWVGTDYGISRFTSENKFISDNRTQTYFYSVLSNNKELYFINLNGWLVNYKTTNKDTIIANSNIAFPRLGFKCILQDYENNFWIGTDNGIIMFNKTAKFIEYYDITLGTKEQNVYALFYSKDNTLYFNDYIQRTYIAPIDTENIKRVETNDIAKFDYDDDDYDFGNNNIMDNRVWDIVEDYNKNMWFATWNGLSQYNTKEKRFYNYANKLIPINPKYKHKKYLNTVKFPTNYFNTILLAKDSSLYFGSYYGLMKYKKGEFYYLHSKFPQLKKEVIYKLVQDTRNRIWGTTNNGYFIIEDDNIEFFNSTNGFKDIKVNTIVEDYKNNFWIATGNGLYQYDGKQYTKYTKKDGLVSANIYVLETDNLNNLIIGTDKGINKLYLKEYYNKDTLILKYYGKEEGFSGVECNRNAIFKDYRGHIWFGTVKGVIEYIPENDYKNTIEPNTFITYFALTKENKTIYYIDSINISRSKLNVELPYTFNNLKFKFIGTSKSIPSKVKYQYKLNKNDNWTDVINTNEVNIPFLPNGNYVLYVRSSNDEGVWDTTPAKLEFIVSTPFYKTTWFIISAIIFGIILIILFVKYREVQLRKEKEILEEKVVERTQEVVKQKEIVEEKNKDITDSINYARNIQRALLPSDEFSDDKLKNSMIFFRPRDIVSGDFYWVSHKPNRTFISAADSTGHGVPGAFMSMLGLAFLDEIVDKNPMFNPAQILNNMRENIIKSLKQKGKSGEQKDGMDMSLCMLDWENKKLEFAGANNPLYLVSKDKDKIITICKQEKQTIVPVLEGENAYNLFEIKADKMPIGYYIKTDDFTNYSLDLKHDDTIYMFSDGLPDQFGGPKGKKFKYKPFKRLLLSLEDYKMEERENVMDKVFTEWVEGYEQIDDVIVLGVKF